jgi:hypothetical protein
MPRDQEDYVKTGIFGGNQVGKTTWLLKACKQIYNTRHADKVIFYTDQNPPSLEGLVRFSTIDQVAKFKHGIVKFYDYKDPMKGISDMMELCYLGKLKGGADVGGAIIYDDCKNYMKSQNEGAITKWMANHRTYNFDLYFVAHDFKQMPLYVRERLEVYNVFKVLKNITAKDLDDMGYTDAEGLYDAYFKVNCDPDMRANSMVDVKLFYEKFRKKMQSK